ncbi:MAG: ABC transporter permease subunit [Candidatus Izemoplasmatales bacterium]|nr:ABC transporter permease subunit [Candidatus Izemoplasmatales bacterium]
MSWALFKANIRNNGLIWSIMTCVFIMYFAIILAMYDPEYLELMDQLLALFPEALIKAMNFDQLGTTLFSFMSGYLYGFLVFLFPMVVSVVVNHRLIATQVDSGSMAFLLSTPNSRTKIIVTQMVFSFVSHILMIAIYTGIGLFFAEVLYPQEMAVGPFLLLNVYAMVLYLVIGGIGFFFSVVANDKSVSLGFGLGIPVAFLIFQMLSSADDDLSFFRYLTLFTLFDPSRVGVDNLAIWVRILIMIGVASVLYMGAIMVFRKKNLYI